MHGGGHERLVPLPLQPRVTDGGQIVVSAAQSLSLAPNYGSNERGTAGQRVRADHQEARGRREGAGQWAHAPLGHKSMHRRKEVVERGDPEMQSLSSG